MCDSEMKPIAGFPVRLPFIKNIGILMSKLGCLGILHAEYIIVMCSALNKIQNQFESLNGALR